MDTYSTSSSRMQDVYNTSYYCRLKDESTTTYSRELDISTTSYCRLKDESTTSYSRELDISTTSYCRLKDEYTTTYSRDLDISAASSSKMQGLKSRSHTCVHCKASFLSTRR